MFFLLLVREADILYMFIYDKQIKVVVNMYFYYVNYPYLMQMSYVMTTSHRPVRSELQTIHITMGESLTVCGHSMHL